MSLPHFMWDYFMPLVRSFGCALLQMEFKSQKGKKRILKWKVRLEGQTHGLSCHLCQQKSARPNWVNTNRQFSQDH